MLAEIGFFICYQDHNEIIIKIEISFLEGVILVLLHEGLPLSFSKELQFHAVPKFWMCCAILENTVFTTIDGHGKSIFKFFL